MYAAYTYSSPVKLADTVNENLFGFIRGDSVCRPSGFFKSYNAERSQRQLVARLVSTARVKN
jgi:hypothetical protein